MITNDKNEPLLKQTKENGQQEAYLVLSDDEKAKGFIRPVRRSYIHVGKTLNHFKGIHRMLDETDKPDLRPKYVAVMTVMTDEDGSFKAGTYVTQQELDAWKAQKRIGGCGTRTDMHQSIAETYARNPKFYSATFCCGCGTHLPVNEFFWDGTSEEVGS
jgi:hypothetical protein